MPQKGVAANEVLLTKVTAAKAAIASVKGIKASTCRLGRWLKGDGYEGKDKKVNRKKMKCYLGIKEYREDDEEY